MSTDPFAGNTRSTRPRTPRTACSAAAALRPGARTEPAVNIGTIGHVDHGKTTLTAAVTQVLAARGGGAFVPFDRLDRTPEERIRGITVHPGLVEYATDTRRYTHVDLPGHADHTRTTAAGLCGLDGAILVVSAADGVMPQTAEHVLLARQAGVAHVVVALNKAETCEDDDAVRVEQSVRRLLTAQGYEGGSAPVVQVSAVGALAGRPRWTAAVDALLDAVETYVPPPARAVAAPLLLPVVRVLTVTGRGTVVTGAVERGTVRVGDPVHLVGADGGPRACTVTGLQSFGRPLERAAAGDRVALLLRGVPREAVRRGHVVAAPGTLTPGRDFAARVRLLSGREGGRTAPVRTGFRPQFHLRTADLTGGVDLGAPALARPGTTVAMTVRLGRPAPLEAGLGFAVREGGRTIGAGTVTEVL
ncbi:elongation factor Tu [Streptomyces clavuligerus]|uniref:Elongation factor Tu n=2 Tax=Streptomyces clavuligerus TaxID=1901 RepID=E2PU28_STRCL|nr:elongation factor Tu [Streptomyces clavuligerus]AXU15866.1 elongation factor Tu [Streptomyces clavuligerus]EFG05647.1 elongation factor Tu [Streptomyces clavuligerus]MBY6305989.1 elongation factor Tu [Streptomyces clavuligerus]QCS08648.1 elongation factor Tu [Streptomyces clavuligerus]QPJ92019.1 elongation factor Tu [Streptomyces clavuligerus]